MTEKADKSVRPAWYAMSGRGKARLLTLIAYIVAALGLGLGNYTYYLWGSSHDRSGDRMGFVIWTVIAMAFVAGTFLTRWLAIVSCAMAVMGFFMFITYPITSSLSHFWGQALALVCYVMAFVSSITIVTTSAEQRAQRDQQ
jgi:hypothetical protein